MNNIEIVRAYFEALDANDFEKVDRYLSDEYQLIDFGLEPMDKSAMQEFIRRLKIALPNLKHSLSNISAAKDTVYLTVQRSGTNLGNFDLRNLGLGVLPKTKKFIIFPNGYYEITIRDEKIFIERDVSPVSSYRRMPGLLKAFGVDAVMR